MQANNTIEPRRHRDVLMPGCSGVLNPITARPGECIESSVDLCIHHTIDPCKWWVVEQDRPSTIALALATLINPGDITAA